MDKATIEQHEVMVASLRRDSDGNPIRPAHTLNDRTVALRDGARAQSVTKGGPDYVGGELIVVAVMDGRAIVAGRMGGAVAHVADLVVVEG